MKEKYIVKMTVGPYTNMCDKVKRVGPKDLLAWLRSHDDSQLRLHLTQHIVHCHRCKEVHKQAVRLVPPAPDDIVFDPAVCTKVQEHADDLIFWLYTIRDTDTNLFLDASFHLGICDRCPSITDAEQQEIFAMTSAVC